MKKNSKKNQNKKKKILISKNNDVVINKNDKPTINKIQITKVTICKVFHCPSIEGLFNPVP